MSARFRGIRGCGLGSQVVNLSYTARGTGNHANIGLNELSSGNFLQLTGRQTSGTQSLASLAKLLSRETSGLHVRRGALQPRGHTCMPTDSQSGPNTEFLTIPSLPKRNRPPMRSPDRFEVILGMALSLALVLAQPTAVLAQNKHTLPLFAAASHKFLQGFARIRTLIDIKFPTSPWTYFVVPVTAELVSV